MICWYRVEGRDTSPAKANIEVFRGKVRGANTQRYGVALPECLNQWDSVSVCKAEAPGAMHKKGCQEPLKLVL